MTRDELLLRLDEAQEIMKLKAEEYETALERYEKIQFALDRLAASETYDAPGWKFAWNRGQSELVHHRGCYFIPHPSTEEYIWHRSFQFTASARWELLENPPAEPDWARCCYDIGAGRTE